MADPIRWSDPRGGAPEEIQRLLAAAQGGPPLLPAAVQHASAVAVAGLGAGARAGGWWGAMKLLAALSVVGGAGVVVSHRSQRSHPAARRAAAPTAAPRSPDPLRATAMQSDRAAPPIQPAPEVEATPAARPPVEAARPREREAEAAMLERARRLLAGGETALALAVLRDHARRHPHTALAEERDYLTFRAGARGATPAGVAREADRFLQQHPHGIYSSHVRSMREAGE